MASPVYLFTGFLDSGKTTLIKDTLSDPQFMEGVSRTLIVCFEEGEVEYDEKWLDEHHAYIEYVDPRIVDIMKEKVAAYNELQEDIKARREEGKDVTTLMDLATKQYLEILYSNPAGFRLTARMTTNYRQLKTIYHQRKTHRLPEWRAFCDWVETLPNSDFLTDVE